MTKKRSLIVALVAFAALMLPLSRLVSFADSLLCLCHPDTEELTKPLMSAGVISTQLVASAKSVEGYRLMTREWKNGDIVEAVYVSEQAELTEEDVVSASW